MQGTLYSSYRLIVTFLVADVIFATGSGIVCVVLPVYFIEDDNLCPFDVWLFRDTSSFAVLVSESLRPDLFLCLFTSLISNANTSLILFPPYSPLLSSSRDFLNALWLFALFALSRYVYDWFFCSLCFWYCCFCMSLDISFCDFIKPMWLRDVRIWSMFPFSKIISEGWLLLLDRFLGSDFFVGVRNGSLPLSRPRVVFMLYWPFVMNDDIRSDVLLRTLDFLESPLLVFFLLFALFRLFVI